MTSEWFSMNLLRTKSSFQVKNMRNLKVVSRFSKNDENIMIRALESVETIRFASQITFSSLLKCCEEFVCEEIEC